jgi:hypothetical protein
MKNILNVLIGSFLLSGWALSQLPKKAPLEKYSSLWNQSPFTAKPVPVEEISHENPLLNYFLLGISPIGSGYRVTLMEKNDSNKRLYVYSDDEKAPFKIVNVYREPGNPRGTMVEMSAGGASVMMTFREEALVLMTPAAVVSERTTENGFKHEVTNLQVK